MTSTTTPRYAGHRFPPELISYTVWLYFRFPLSLRMVEEMLAFRGIEVSHETIRQWGLKFGQEFANIIRWRLPRPGDKWHMDEVVLKIAGKKHYLWRAVERTPDEAVQVGPTGSAFPVRPRPDQQPLPPAPPPHDRNRLPRRTDPRLPGVARRLRHHASRIART